MLRVKCLKGNLGAIPLPLPLLKRIKTQLGWGDFERLGFGWEPIERGYVLKFWRDKWGKAKIQRWGNGYEIFITDFFLEGELVVKKIYKKESPWLDPMLMIEVIKVNNT